MALVDARVIRSFKLSETKGEKGSIQYSASEDLLVLSDQKDPLFADVLADKTVWPNLGGQKIPQLDDKITVNGKELYVSSRELSYYKENERAILVSVRYDAKDAEAGGEGDGDPSGGDSDAWQRIQIQSVDVTQPARGYRSLLGSRDGAVSEQKPAINSAGDPVDGLEEETSMLRLTYTNTIVSNPNFAALSNYVNKCNFSGLTLLGINLSFYTLRCTGYNAQYDQKNNVWSVTVEFLYNPNGWEITFYDAGFNEIVNGERVAIVDKAGNPISSPCALDGNGRAVVPSVVLEEENLGPAKRLLYPYISTDLGNIFREARI